MAEKSKVTVTRSYLIFIRYPLIFFILSLLVAGVFAKRGFLDWRRMVHENENLKRRLTQYTEQKSQLERDNDLLEKNTEYQEYLIRETLGYIQPNETVIEF